MRRRRASVALVDVVEGHLEGGRGGKGLRHGVAVAAVRGRGDGGVLLQGDERGRVDRIAGHVAGAVQAGVRDALHVVGHGIDGRDGAALRGRLGCQLGGERVIAEW